MHVLSLQTRLLGGLVALFVGSMAVLGFVLLNEAHSRQVQFEVQQARFQAKTLAEASIDALITEDYELMERWVHAVLPSSNYAYAALVRPNGQVLTSVDQSLIGRSMVTTGAQAPSDVQISFLGRPVREMRHPVLSGRSHLANAHVAYYLDKEEILAPETVYKVALTLALLLCALGLGALFISRKIIAPVKALTAAVADTSFDRPTTLGAILSGRHDEVGQLAQSFDALLRRLAQSYETLKDANVALEQRVEERTSDLVNAARRVEESRSRITAIMDNVAEGIVTIDEENNIESFNRAAEALFGYTPDEVIGKSVEILLPQEYGHHRQTHFGRYFEMGLNKTIDGEPRELSARRKNGSQFPIELAVSAVQIGSRAIFIGLIRDITSRKAMVDQLRHVADHDVLTGLFNRRYFHSELERVVARVRRGSCCGYTLLFIDLDKFKLVNDTLGHAAGDRVLVEVSDILKSRARKSDVLARLGGDEFAVLLNDAPATTVLGIAESFRQQVMNYRLKQGEVCLDIGCSIGMTTLDANTASVDDALAQADFACYQAKHAGRNCVRIFDPSDSAAISSKR